MAETDIIGIGIAYDTSQLLTGSRQVQDALRQVEQSERSAQTATQALNQSSTQAATAMTHESQAARQSSQAVQQSAQAATQASQSSRQLAQASQAVAQASQQAASGLTRTSAAASQAGQATAAMGSQTRQAQGAIQDLTQSIGALVASAVALQTLKSAVEGVVGQALRMEALSAAFTAITGSSQGAAAALGFVRETANRLGVNVTSLAGSYKTLLAATDGTKLSLKDTQTLFLGITEAGRAMQLSSEDIVGAIRPIGQILNQQAIQGDEWRNEFGSRIPKAMQLLLEATNGAVKSQGDLSKAMEEGKLKGEVVYDIMANLGELLRSKYAPAAQQAAEGTGASFARLQTAVSELQAAIGQGLNPAMAESARALTAFIQLGKEGGGAFGGQFTQVIREATSAVIGLGGAVVVTGKYIAALGAYLAFGETAFQAGWDDVKQTFTDIIDLQNKVLKGGFAQQPSAPMPAPAATLRPITLGSGEEEKKRRGLTDAEKEAKRLDQERLALTKEITAAYEKALYSERALTELRLERAGFGDEARRALMQRYDETQVLKEINDEEKQRKDLAKDLQDAYDKARLSERELLELKLVSLKASKEETAERLKTYDATVKLTKAAEAKKRADDEAVQATKDYETTVERLLNKLEPQRRRMSRQEQMQQTIGELADVTSDPFVLAKADMTAQSTLRYERHQEQLAQLEDLGQKTFDHLADAIEKFTQTGKFSFKDMIDAMLADFMRFSLQSLSKLATESDWFQGLLKGAAGLLSTPSAGAGGGGAATTSAGALSVVGGDAPGMQFGGPVYSDRAYLVGERGPELFVPPLAGTILPHGTPRESPGGPTVHMTVTTPDADSFRRSRTQIAADMTRAARQARRVL